MDARITLRVSDPLPTLADRITDLTLRVLLSDPAAKSLPESQTIGRAEIRRYYGDLFWYTTPPAKDIVKQIEVRVNGGLLGQPVTENGWLVFRPDPKQFAVGENLIDIVPKGSTGKADDQKLPPQWWVDMNELPEKGSKTVPCRPPGSPAITVQKLELHVKYRRP